MNFLEDFEAPCYAMGGFLVDVWERNSPESPQDFDKFTLVCEVPETSESGPSDHTTSEWVENIMKQFSEDKRKYDIG